MQKQEAQGHQQLLLTCLVSTCGHSGGNQVHQRGDRETAAVAGATVTACTEGQISPGNSRHHFSEEPEAGAGARPPNLGGGGGTL